MKRWLHFMLAAVLAVSLSALAGLTPVQAKETLTFAGGGKDAGQLDPHVSTKTQDKLLFAMIFNGLVRFKPGTMDPAQIEPDLAKSWESSPDGLVWTFHLRQGVQCHGDYGELTAEDVAFSLNRAGDPSVSAVSSDYESFKSVEAVDTYTVRITLKNPVPSLLGLVANYHGGNVVCKAAVEKLGNDGFKLHPVGTGPFAFVEYKANQYVRLSANEDYFRGQPKLDELLYRYVPSDSSRELAVIGGQVPPIDRMPPACRFAPRCPLAESICRERNPALLPLAGDPGHHVRCWVRQRELGTAEEAE